MIRVFLFGLVAVIALWGVWWMPLLLGFVALVLGSGIEIIGIGVLLDMLYGTAPYTGIFTLLFTGLFIVRAVFKKHMF